MELPAEALARLADQASALSRPARLAILQQIREPLRLVDIRVRAEHGPARERESPMSRQAVRRHLAVLESYGLARRAGSGSDRYVVAHANVFALLDSLQALTKIRPVEEVAQSMDRTMVGTQDDRGRIPHERRLLVVRGPHEGTAFPLSEGQFRIGRTEPAEIILDQDPFVSGAHAELDVEADRVSVRPLAPRNPLRVNLDPLDEGWRVLQRGDVLSVGRSHIVIQA